MAALCSGHGVRFLRGTGDEGRAAISRPYMESQNHVRYHVFVGADSIRPNHPSIKHMSAAAALGGPRVDRRTRAFTLIFGQQTSY